MTPSLLPNITISVETDPSVAGVSVPESDWFTAAIRHGLAQILEPDTPGQVSLLITDDETVRDLNRTYRGLDETTDVLSFSAQHAGHWEGDDDPDTQPPASEPPPAEPEHPDNFPIPDDELPPIGDIVISLPQASRQAQQQNVPLCRELALLLVHGALHLLGHDHYDDSERRAMQELEQRALSAIFGPSEG